MVELPPLTGNGRAEVHPVDTLTTFHKNPRSGDVAIIAESLRRNAQYRPIVVNEGTRTGRPLEVLAGNHTLLAARELGWPSIQCWVIDVDELEARRIVAVDNASADAGGYDEAILADLLGGLGGDLEGTGYTDRDLAKLLRQQGRQAGGGGYTEEDYLPEQPAIITEPGDLWLLGDHRVLCGDSTDPEAVALVTLEQRVALVHADPPYGMGKEADGIANDNLHRDDLDAFQLAWWRAWSKATADNGSAYIWGTAPDLWRLWYVGGLAGEGDLVLRNEIVWNKGSSMAMGTAGHHSYPTISERCLFVMRGQQFLGNQNTEDYWEGYEPLRVWLVAEVEKAGWTKRDVNHLTGTQMAGHWLSKSQFIPISRTHYEALAEAAGGAAFTAGYDALFERLFPEVRAGGNEYRRELGEQLREGRAYFDNTHENMGDVWSFNRVAGAERFGHATPKPVGLCRRAILSSTRPGDWVGVPFGGTGPEVIAAEQAGRRAAVLELDAGYVDIICRRWQQFTGRQPVLERTGEQVDFDAPTT